MFIVTFQRHPLLTSKKRQGQEDEVLWTHPLGLGSLPAPPLLVPLVALDLPSTGTLITLVPLRRI